MKHKLIKITLLLVFIFSFGANLFAQEGNNTISGTVVDEFDEPLIGVEVDAENSKKGTITNSMGNYSVSVPDNITFLIFSYDGYGRQKVLIDEKNQIDIRLEPDPLGLDEKVHLGYTTQLRREISGAVSTVSGEELKRAPVTNFAQTLPGRLSGLFTQETSSELSKANTNFYVRGLAAARASGPLVMIDGIITAYLGTQTLDYLTPGEIESVTILKDASTQSLYGIQGANGIIVITTKKGKKGGLVIDGRIDQSVQETTTRPTFYNSGEYATMRNQAAFNDGLGRNHFFTDQQIENYRSGENPEMFPNNDWYNMYMKDLTFMERVGVNVSGGSENVQFFSNLNFMHQGGMFKTEQTEYNPNANNTWINYRINVDMKLNEYLSGFVRLSGNVRRNKTPGVGNNTSIYSSLFIIPPTMYGPVTPEVFDYETGEVLDPGGEVITTQNVGSPTYGMLNRTGYYRSTVTNTMSQFGLDLDLKFLTKGLNMTGVLAYQTNSGGNLGTTQDYERYIRNSNIYDLGFIKNGSQQNSPLVYSKGSHYYYHLTYKSVLNYNRDFGRHKIGGMGYAFYQNLTKADVSAPELLPYNRLSTGVEASYGYDNRYLLKLDVGYSGSEQYARASRFIATPAVSAAWVVSNEALFADANWLSNLKLRASYGKTANDESGLGRFAYSDNVTVVGGGPIPYFQYMIFERQIGNPNVQAEVSTKQNYGLDLGLFNSLSVSVDIFNEYIDNMIVSPAGSIPLYQGVPLGNYPKTNSGVFKNEGYELSADFKRKFNRNLSLFVGGMFSYAENTVVNSNQPELPSDYSFTERQNGFSYGQQFGYLVDYNNGNGFFNSESELQNSNLTYDFGQPRVGDLKFQDLNNDNIIDQRDQAPIGTGAIPRIIYGVSGGMNFKSFDLNFLFQGLGEYSSIYGGFGVYETDYDGVFGALHRNAWTQERYENGELITAPALSTQTTVNRQANDYYSYDRSYLRLKNVELGFTLPETATRAISAQKIRFLLSGQNLITWDNMPSDDFGPEGGYASFPVYRVYNLGLNIVF